MFLCASTTRERISLLRRISCEYSLDETHSLKMSAPLSFRTSAGSMELPSDFDIFRPSSATTNPLVTTSR